jgi:phosphate transport system substrate-binding protein
MKYLYMCAVIGIVACSSDTTTIKVKGSDTEVNLAVQMAESFHRSYPSVLVSVSGGGSGLGIASLLNGTADIANSSRRIKPEELRLFERKGTPIDSLIFAQDAIAFVVSSDLPIDSIFTTDLADILKGKHLNWSSVTKEDRPINIYGRQSNSGTYDFVKQRLGIDFTPYAKQMNGNGQILEAIKADHSGIGYVGAGYINDTTPGIKILLVYTDESDRAVSPLDSSMVAAGKYFFQRPLFQYYKASSYNKVKVFLDFEKSDAGKNVIQSSGYYPATGK